MLLRNIHPLDPFKWSTDQQSKKDTSFSEEHFEEHE
ncbi:MAG: hypothetical protein KatS3mg089_0528 [Patescibacteria group bacterium]|nr:MAG: hypothetical protein KatS3mg089_0528 [Patescibacteria group bacterium]